MSHLTAAHFHICGQNFKISSFHTFTLSLIIMNRVMMRMSHLTAAHFHLLGQNVKIYNCYIFILSLIIIEQGDDEDEPFNSSVLSPSWSKCQKI